MDDLMDRLRDREGAMFSRSDDILMSDAIAEIDMLRVAIEHMNPGFCVEEAIALFGTPMGDSNAT